MGAATAARTFYVPNPVSDALRIYGGALWPLLLLAFFSASANYLPFLILALELAANVQLVTGLFTVVVGAAMTHVAYTYYLGERVDLLRSGLIALRKFWTILAYMLRLIGAMLLLAVTVIGLPFAVRTFVRWNFGVEAMIVRDMDSKSAISHSSRLVKGHGWQVLGIILLIPAASAALVYVLRWVVLDNMAASVAVSIGFSTAVVPLIAAVRLLLFLRLEELKPSADRAVALS